MLDFGYYLSLEEFEWENYQSLKCERPLVYTIRAFYYWFTKLGGATMTKYYPAGFTYYKNKKISVNKIEVSDIWVSLELGWRDFMHQPSHYFFAIILYPFIGIILWLWASKENTIQLIFPMMSGFALFGPFIAIFLYEISRRLESGLDTSWSQIFRLVYSPALRQIIILSIMLLFIFFTWMVCAYILFQLLYGSNYPISMFNFFINIITTPRGWLLIVLGNGMGACFALTALYTTVVAFPILIDTEISAIKAIQISMLAVRINPIPLICWGFLVSFGLLMGVLCVMIGLIIALPVFGHATWHLYRRLVNVSC